MFQPELLPLPLPDVQTFTVELFHEKQFRVLTFERQTWTMEQIDAANRRLREAGAAHMQWREYKPSKGYLIRKA